MPFEVPFPETRFDLLGVTLHRLDREQLLRCFEAALEAEGPAHFAYLNVAVSNQAADDPGLRGLLNKADLVYVDGAGIQLGCRILGAACPPRTTAADFLPEVLRMCARMGKSVGFLGGTPGAAERVRAIYSCHVDRLRINFVRNGFGELADAPGWQRELAADPPDLLLVGLGVPRQEEWIDWSRNRFPVRLYWSVGALFEYDGGTLARCPAWLGRIGLEWLYRLLVEPKRLWKRYLIGNPRFLLRCLSSRWRGRGAMP
jgi:N-acetylglucosaminyldiphosphoundecaprenol N-acetyl-beta-D-mannosaminyltransferase